MPPCRGRVDAKLKGLGRRTERRKYGANRTIRAWASRTVSAEIFGRKTPAGDIAILHVSDGAPVTRLAATYPVGSTVSARYEHPKGIVLTPADAAKLKIEVE